jgi:hypothetical protein
MCLGVELQTMLSSLFAVKRFGGVEAWSMSCSGTDWFRIAETCAALRVTLEITCCQVTGYHVEGSELNLEELKDRWFVEFLLILIT